MIPLNGQGETKRKFLPNSGRNQSYTLYFQLTLEPADGLLGQLAEAGEEGEFVRKSALLDLSSARSREETILKQPYNFLHLLQSHFG